MDRRTKLQIAAAAAAALVIAIALGAAGALAVTNALDDDEVVAAADTSSDREDEESQDDEREDGPDADDALGKALDFLLDEAVEAGRLTEEEADELREDLESGVAPLVLPRAGDRLFDRELAPFGRLFFGPELDLEVAAEYLELSTGELKRELADGESLADIARDEGKSVDGLVDALVDAARLRIDDAVDSGLLSEERAQELEDGLEERIRDRVSEEWSFRWPFRDLWRGLEPFRGQPG